MFIFILIILIELVSDLLYLSCKKYKTNEGVMSFTNSLLGEGRLKEVVKVRYNLKCPLHWNTVSSTLGLLSLDNFC